MHRTEALSIPSHPPAPPSSQYATVSQDTVGEDTQKEAQPLVKVIQSSDSITPYPPPPPQPNSVDTDDADQALNQASRTRGTDNIIATPSNRIIEHTHLPLIEKNSTKVTVVTDIEGYVSRSGSRSSESIGQGHVSNKDAPTTLTALSTQSLTPPRALSPSSQGSSTSQHVSHRPISYVPPSDGRPRQDIPYDSPASLATPVGFVPISGPNRRTTMYFDSARISRDSVISYDSRDGDKARQKDRTCWQAFKRFLQRPWNS